MPSIVSFARHKQMSTAPVSSHGIAHPAPGSRQLTGFSRSGNPALVSLARKLLRCTTSAVRPSLGFAAHPVEPFGSFWYHDVLASGAVASETARADDELRSGLFVPVARGCWRGFLED